MAVNTKYSYNDFREAVREKLKDYLRAWKLTPDVLEAYMQQEEDQIKGAYRSYTDDDYDTVRKGTRTEDDCFRSAVATVAYCLEMCY